MAIIAKEESGTNTPIPEDSHVARCVLVVDIGKHETKFGFRDQVLIGWELPLVMREFDGIEEPAILCNFYTRSLAEKANLRRDLERWRGQRFSTEELQGFDLERLAGAPALLSVIHKQSKPHIDGVAKLPSAMSCPEQLSTTQIYNINDPDHTAFESLPRWIQDQVKQSEQWKQMVNAGDLPESEPDSREDEIPF